MHGLKEVTEVETLPDTVTQAASFVLAWTPFFFLMDIVTQISPDQARPIPGCVVLLWGQV